MSMLKCTNCGQVYNDGNTHYCLRCNIKLQPINTVVEVKNPNLTDTSNRVIGLVSDTPTITCPYCKSTNCKKITATAKAVNVALFGIFGNKRRYQWHCEKCGSDF